MDIIIKTFKNKYIFLSLYSILNYSRHHHHAWFIDYDVESIERYWLISFSIKGNVILTAFHIIHIYVFKEILEPHHHFVWCIGKSVFHLYTL